MRFIALLQPALWYANICPALLSQLTAVSRGLCSKLVIEGCKHTKPWTLFSQWLQFICLQRFSTAVIWNKMLVCHTWFRVWVCLLEVNLWIVMNYVINLWVLIYTLHLFAWMFWMHVQASRGQSPDLSSTNASHDPHSHQFTVIIPTALVSSINVMRFHSFINLWPVMWGGRAHKLPLLASFTPLHCPFSFVLSRLSFFLFSHLSFLTCHLLLSFVLFLALCLSLSLFNFAIVYCPVMWERQEAE